MRDTIHHTILRICLACACFGFSYRAATIGYTTTQWTLLVASIPLFALGVFVIWKPLFALLTRPLMAMIDGIFFPGGKLEKPILNLKLPAYYIKEGRYTEALEEYRKIIKYYPDEVEAYERAMWLCQEIFHDSESAAKLLRRARKRHLALDPRMSRFVELGGKRNRPGEPAG